MNSLQKNYKPQMTAKEPFIAGASELMIDDYGARFSHNENKDIYVESDAQQINITVRNDLDWPLVIDTSIAKKLNIVVNAKVTADIILKASLLTEELALSLKKASRAVIYFLPSSLDQIDLTQTFNAKVVADAQLTVFEIGNFFGRLHRTLDIELLEESAAASYFGLDHLDHRAVKKSLLTITHKALKTKSTQAFRGIYSGFAHGTFLGKVVVEKNASLSQAKQLYKAILMSEQAKAHVMPQLEINNNDISASHGASIGELDKHALFYLCSRGLSYACAKSLLVMSLLNDILDQIEKPFIKSAIKQDLARAIEHSLGIDS